MLKYWLWLSNLPGLQNLTRLALLRHFASPEDIYYADEGEILLTEGITRQQAALLRNHDLSAADRILADCQRLDQHILTIQDAAYPNRLRNIYDPPCLLYWKGHMLAFDQEAAISVVGTRKCTPYGEASAEKLGYGLASGGALVVSGLAEGVDGAAARGALRAGGIVAGVAGCGLDVRYPYVNRYLYDDVAAAGVLLSEYPPGASADGWHFPVRNRILAGLSIATLVVEAPEKSGALITANAAIDQGRDVFAVPGPIDALASAGCNRLIQDGVGLVMDARDILACYEARFPDKLCVKAGKKEPAAMGYQALEKPEPKPVAPTLRLADKELTDDQIALLRALSDQEPALVDDLIELTGIPTRRVLSALTLLEIENLVRQHSGKRYTRAVTIIE